MSIWQADGYWVRDTHYPRPVLPLFVSYGLEPVEVGSARAYEECSFPIERYRYLVLHGYVFQRSEPYGGDAPPIMARFPILFHLWRVNPKLRRRILTFDQFVREGGFERNVTAWTEVWSPEAKKRLETIRPFDRKKADFPEIADHLDACYEYLCWSWCPHSQIVLLTMYVQGRWVELRLLFVVEGGTTGKVQWWIIRKCQLFEISWHFNPHKAVREYWGCHVTCFKPVSKIMIGVDKNVVMWFQNLKVIMDAFQPKHFPFVIC